MPEERIVEGAQVNRRWRPALMSFFLRRVHDHAEAEDLTQEVFSRLLGRQDQAPLHEGYLFSVANNLLRDRARRTRVRSAYRQALSVVDGAGVELLDPFKILQARSTLAQVGDTLNELPELTREIFVLYRLENISMDSIAESLGISNTTVKVHVRKAMALLIKRTRDCE